MAKLLLDFKDVNLEGPEPIPAGVYTAKIDCSELNTPTPVKKSKGGNSYVSICYVIQDHPQYTGRKIYENYMTEGKGTWKIGLILKAFGVLTPENYSPDKPKFILDTAILHGALCKIQVSQETYEGKTRNRVDKVAPLDAEATKTRKIPF